MTQRYLGILTGARVVERARSAIGHGTIYLLGGGGRNPFTAIPDHELDCSGFVAWVLGVDRYLENTGLPHLDGRAWLETTAVYDDARSPLGSFAEIPWISARPGDLVVWPDNKLKKRQGHIGVVATVANGPNTVVHCSSGNYKGPARDAIQETPADLFARNNAIVARAAWVIA